MIKIFLKFWALDTLTWCGSLFESTDNRARLGVDNALKPSVIIDKERAVVWRACNTRTCLCWPGVACPPTGVVQWARNMPANQRPLRTLCVKCGAKVNDLPSPLCVCLLLLPGFSYSNIWHLMMMKIFFVYCTVLDKIMYVCRLLRIIYNLARFFIVYCLLLLHFMAMAVCAVVLG